MLESHLEIPDLVEGMRSAFDRSFEVPAVTPDSDVESFLAVTAAGEPLALRFSDLNRVEARAKTVALPSSRRGLLGLTGLQGMLVPVFSLAAILGINPTDTGWRWIAVCSGESPFGVAFESIQCRHAVRRSEFLPSRTETAIREHVHHASLRGGEILQIVDLPSIRRAVLQSAIGREASREQ